MVITGAACAEAVLRRRAGAGGCCEAGWRGHSSWSVPTSIARPRTAVRPRSVGPPPRSRAPPATMDDETVSVNGAKNRRDTLSVSSPSGREPAYPSVTRSTEGVEEIKALSLTRCSVRLNFCLQPWGQCVRRENATPQAEGQSSNRTRSTRPSAPGGRHVSVRPSSSVPSGETKTPWTARRPRW